MFLQKAYSNESQHRSQTADENYVSVLGRDEGYTVKYSPLPEGTPEGGGLYLTVYPESSPNMGSISFLRIIMIMMPS